MSNGLRKYVVALWRGRGKGGGRGGQNEMLTIITIKWRSLSQWWADHSLYEIEVRWGGGGGEGGHSSSRLYYC